MDEVLSTTGPAADGASRGVAPEILRTIRQFVPLAVAANRLGVTAAKLKRHAWLSSLLGLDHAQTFRRIGRVWLVDLAGYEALGEKAEQVGLSAILKAWGPMLLGQLLLLLILAGLVAMARLMGII